ncbi:MAG: hypothetical protein D6738_02770 [Acidobacteria bacterium]|nr:MAG: hypothetical protein D6738_02770 [Acidobacteriota bacterium]
METATGWWGRPAILAGLAVGLVSPAFAQTAPIAGGPRAEMPVVLHGSDLPQFAGVPEADLAAFRWDGSAWVRIPLQVDPVYDVDLCSEVPGPVNGSWPPIPPGADPAVTCREKRIDVSGLLEGNSVLDDDDEVVFLVREAGQRRPAGTADPPGAGPAFYEIRLRDDGASPPEEGWIYLYAGTSVPEPAGYAISVDTQTGRLAGDAPPPGCTAADNQYTTVETDGFCLYWATRWSLDDLILKDAPTDGCGTALGSWTAEDPRDVLDRWKGHEQEVGGAVDDDYWGCRSAFVDADDGIPRPGEKIGPVRYVRGVLGAKSAVNTTAYTMVYPRYIETEVRLRVHPMTGIARLLDWAPATKGVHTLYRQTSRRPGAPMADPVDGSLSTGCQTVPGKFDGACVVEDDLRAPGVDAWALLAAPGRPRVFAFSRPLVDPSRFTRDPALDPDYKGFESFYADHHGAGRALNENPGEEEDDGSLANTGFRFDVRTPPETCRAFCTGVSEQTCLNGPSPTDPGCQADPETDLGTYYQPLVHRDALMVLAPAPSGEDQAAAGERLARLEREPVAVTAFYDDGSTTCRDGDGDGWGAPNVAACPNGPGPDDCDDANPAVHPGMLDVCNGIDDDCDPGSADGSEDPQVTGGCDGPDADACAEGTGTCSGGVLSCSDASGDSPEICGNGTDDDCDGPVEPADTCTDGATVSDVNGSGRVDGFDLATLARAFGAGCGDPRYDASVDLDQDCLVDGDDLSIMATAFGRRAP